MRFVVYFGNGFLLARQALLCTRRSRFAKGFQLGWSPGAFNVRYVLYGEGRLRLNGYDRGRLRLYGYGRGRLRLYGYGRGRLRLNGYGGDRLRLYGYGGDRLRLLWF